MFEINLKYNYFKEIVFEKQLLWQYTETDTVYNIFAIDSSIKYNTTLYKNTDGIIGINTEEELANTTDFEKNYKPNANKPLSLNQTAYQSKFKGYLLEIPVNETTGYIDIEFDKDIYLSKVFPIPINAEFGDYVEMDALLKHNNYKIRNYAETMYIYGTDPKVWIEGPGAGKIPNFCKIRVTYKAVSNTGRKFILWFEFLIK